MSKTTNLKLFKHNEPLESNTNKFDVDKALNQNWDKIDNYVGETNKKLNTLEEDNTTNKQDISSIKSEQTEQDKQIDILLNALPAETQEAENINLKGTIPVKFKEFVVKGNSKQETRSGKNMLNINSADIVNSNTTIEVENNILTITGTSTNNFYSAIPIKLKPNTDYSISTLATVVEQNGLGQSAYIRVRSDLAGSWIGNSIFINKDLTTQQNLKGTFNSGDNETAYLILYLNALNDGTQRSAKIEFENLQIEEGTTSTAYEPYGAMPSPEFPSEIKNVEGDVNVTVSNKNLFTGLVKGISINHTTGEEGKSDKSSASDFIKVNFDTNLGYYLSGLTNTMSSYVAFYNKDKKYLGRTGGFEQLFISFSANSFSSKAPDYETIEDKNITFVRITQYVTAVSPGTIDDIDNLQIQLEPGTTATNYVEHREQTVTFPLSEGQKLMLGDYLAADGIHHKRTQIELPLFSKLQSTSIGGVNCQFASYLIADIKRENEMSNNFLCEKVSFSGNQFNKYKGYIIQKNFVVLTDLEDTVENNWLKSI